MIADPGDEIDGTCGKINLGSKVLGNMTAATVTVPRPADFIDGPGAVQAPSDLGLAAVGEQL